MIVLTRLTGQVVVVNADLILLVEATPDTMVTFTNGTQLYVREPVDAVVDRVVAQKRQVHAGPPASTSAPGEETV